MPKPHNAAALPLPTSPPLPSPAILCTKRRTTSRRRRCSACPAPQTAIHAPVRGLRLNRNPGNPPQTPASRGRHDPCLDECHDPRLDGSHGPSLGGPHDLLHLTPTLYTKRRTTPRRRHRSAFPAPQTAIHATPQHPGPNTPEPGLGPHTSPQDPKYKYLRTYLRDIHEAYSQAASNRTLTRDFAVSDLPMNNPPYSAGNRCSKPGKRLPETMLTPPRASTME